MKNLKLRYILVFFILVLFSCQGNSSQTGTDSTKVDKPKPKNGRGYLGKWKEVDGDYFFTLEAREDGKVYFLFKDSANVNNTYPCDIETGRGRNQKDELIEKIIINPTYKNGKSVNSFAYDPVEDSMSSETYKRNWFERR